MPTYKRKTLYDTNEEPASQALQGGHPPIKPRKQIEVKNIHGVPQKTTILESMPLALIPKPKKVPKKKK